MADDFDPSPRPSKRRKTYASGRKILKSPEGNGALSSVSTALSSLSNRILGRKKQQLEKVLHDDSAYGSKEDSLNEDEIVVTEEVDRQEGERAAEEQHENEIVPERSTRRSARKSTEVKQGPLPGTPLAGKPDAEVVEKGGKIEGQVGKRGGSNETRPQESGTRRRSTRKSLPTGAESDAPQKREGRSTDVQHKKSRKQKSKGQALEVDGQEPVETDTVEEADPAAPTDKVDANDVEETVEPQPRSSGRERRKPRRFSIEKTSAEEPGYVEASARRARVGSPAKASSAVASPQPKGILTPSRRRRQGPPKSVVFHESDKTIEQRLGFKDIESPGKKTRNAMKEHAEIPETPPSAVEDDEDLLLDPNPPQDILQTLELPAYPKDVPRTGQPEDTPAVTTIKSLVLSRLTSATLPSSPPPHLSTQYSTLHSLLTSTIAAGESNSLLLLGSRGSGKSMLIGTALTDLSSKHKDGFHIVRLNGFFQTDDRLALREIWRQLGREREAIGEVEENDTTEVSGSYADTMASLLSLLSHPDEFDRDPDAMDTELPENHTKASKSVVIILDEFDLFTLHPRQTLLYNLFDIAQSKKAPIAVIGCSTRMDVVECLEKRVKSRFSHRWIHVPSIKSVEGMKEAVERILCLEEGDDANVPNEDRHRWNEYIKVSSWFLQTKSSKLTGNRLPSSHLHQCKHLPSKHFTPPSRYPTSWQHCTSPSQPCRSHHRPPQPPPQTLRQQANFPNPKPSPNPPPKPPLPQPHPPPPVKSLFPPPVSSMSQSHPPPLPPSSHSSPTSQPSTSPSSSPPPVSKPSSPSPTRTSTPPTRITSNCCSGVKRIRTVASRLIRQRV